MIFSPGFDSATNWTNFNQLLIWANNLFIHLAGSLTVESVPWNQGMYIVMKKKESLSFLWEDIPLLTQKENHLLLKKNKPRKLIALGWQGAQPQRLESLTVTPPGMWVNTGYINSAKGTSSKKDAPRWHPPFQARSATQVCTGLRQNQFLFKIRHSP